jgi:hypothetical protein
VTAPELPVTLDSLIRAVENSAPDDRLAQLANASATASLLGDVGDSLLGVFVDRCRRDGRSWAEIGGALGVTKQAVQKRFVATPPVLADATLQRFTVRAKNVLTFAADEARALEHGYRGTEHLLLALFVDQEGLAAIALGELGIGHDEIRDSLLEIVPRGDVDVAGDPPFTPRAVRALEFALSAALELGHNSIGTEHMLLGVLREGSGIGAHLLRDRGVEEDAVKARVVELLSGYPS